MCGLRQEIFLARCTVVVTKFSVLLFDDDFWSSTGVVKKAGPWLRDHVSYIASSGRGGEFTQPRG